MGFSKIRGTLLGVQGLALRGPTQMYVFLTAG